MSLVSLLVLVLVFGLVFYCVQLLPLPAPFKQIAIVIVILIAIFALLGMIGIGPGIHLR